jgi:hypothetical protein
MNTRTIGIALLAIGGLGPGLDRAAAAAGPDVTYLQTSSIWNWGVVGGIRGYSLGSYTCNIGNQNLDWGGNTPLLAMNAYRLRDGRLEQIGMSWVKNGTVAAATSGCGLACNGQGGGVLGAGCRDVYGSSYNGGQSILGPRSAVNPVNGTYPGPSGGSGNAIFKRLQIHETDLNPALNPGALYFVEGQYVAWDDALAGNAMNNASYKRVTVSGGAFDLTPVNALTEPNVQTPAIYAWKEHGNGVNMPDPAVQISSVDVFSDGRFYVASKARDLGDGTWRYDYAVLNFNSARAGGWFIVPVPGGVTHTAHGYHDVDYHSGEPYPNVDWNLTAGATSARWDSPQTFAENANSNALRWGTMYNYWFIANSAPVDGAVTIGLFKPGAPTEVTAAASVPGPPAPPPCPADANGDGTVDVQDLTGVILAWGCTTCPAEDVNDDGVVDVTDIIDVTLAWGDCQ